ncbi:carbonic anhydrase 2-like [Haematobia irritans]|uniref:carbonic anhydrase 2-like n=1 Tax=Haematobia irritans TaxID=7368 RepID=UPI003F4F6403
MSIKFENIGILLLAVLCNVNAWTYREQDQWPEEYPQCGGDRQSPIAINTFELGPQPYPPIKYTNYKQEYNVTITNAGHTAQITIPDDADGAKPQISGGPLPTNETYQFVNLHFHWGANNTLGSDHVINGLRYPMEVHGVHYNTKYKSLEEALQNADGVTVLAAFYEVTLSHRLKPLDDVDKALQFIKNPNTSTMFSNFKLSGMYGGIDTTAKRTFYTYPGSLTTPECSQAVTWIIFPNFIPVASDQLKPFRKLLNFEGNALVNNFRELQDQNGRKVYNNRACRSIPLVRRSI